MLKLARSFYGKLDTKSIIAALQLTDKKLVQSVADVIFRQDFLGQTTALSLTTGYTTRSEEAGIYLVLLDFVITAVGTGGTISCSVSWNNGVANTNATSALIATTGLGNEGQLNQVIYSGGLQNISVSTNFSGVTGSPKYDFRARVSFFG